MGAHTGKRLHTLVAIMVFLVLPALSLAADDDDDDGEKVPNLCWLNEAGSEFCLQDYKKTVRVLLYSNAHCRRCEILARTLVPRLAAFDDQKIVTISLITEGRTYGSMPPLSWMKQWKDAFQVTAVGLSPRDAGTAFFSRPTVPNVVVIDADMTLALKTLDPSVQGIVDAVRELKDDGADQDNDT